MGQTVNTNLRYHPHWRKNAHFARTVMRSAGITAAAAVGYYSPFGFLPALVSPFTARSAATLSPIRGSLKVSCAITPLTQRFLKYGVIVSPFLRMSSKNFIGRRYLHSIFSSCGAVSAMRSAPAISSFSRPRKPQLTAISGRPALRAVDTSTSLSPTYTAFSGRTSRSESACAHKGWRWFRVHAVPLAEGRHTGEKLFRQRLGGGVRLVGDNGGLHTHFFQLRQDLRNAGVRRGLYAIMGLVPVLVGG